MHPLYLIIELLTKCSTFFLIEGRHNNVVVLFPYVVIACIIGSGWLGVAREQKRIEKNKRFKMKEPWGGLSILGE